MTLYPARKAVLHFLITATFMLIPLWADATGLLGPLTGSRYLGEPLDLKTIYEGDRHEFSQLHPSCIRASLKDVSDQSTFEFASQDLKTTVHQHSRSAVQIRIYSQTPFNLPLARLSLVINCPLSKLSKSWTLFGQSIRQPDKASYQKDRAAIQHDNPPAREFSLKGSMLLAQSRLKPKDEAISPSQSSPVATRRVREFAPSQQSEVTLSRTALPPRSFVASPQNLTEAWKDSPDSDGSDRVEKSRSTTTAEDELLTMAGNPNQDAVDQYFNAGLIESKSKSPQSSLGEAYELAEELPLSDSQLPFIVAFAGLFGLLTLTLFFGFRWISGRKRLKSTAQGSASATYSDNSFQDSDDQATYRANMLVDSPQREFGSDNTLLFQSFLESDELQNSSSPSDEGAVAATQLSPEVCDLLQMISGSEIRPWILNDRLQQLVNQYGAELPEADLSRIRLNKCNLAMIELAARKASQSNEVYQPEVDLIMECLKIDRLGTHPDGQPGLINDMVTAALNSKCCEMPQDSNIELFKCNLMKLQEQTQGYPLCFADKNWADLVEKLGPSKIQ